MNTIVTFLCWSSPADLRRFGQASTSGSLPGDPRPLVVWRWRPDAGPPAGPTSAGKFGWNRFLTEYNSPCPAPVHGFASTTRSPTPGACPPGPGSGRTIPIVEVRRRSRSRGDPWGEYARPRAGIQHPVAPLRHDRSGVLSRDDTVLAENPNMPGHALHGPPLVRSRSASRRAASYPFHRGLHACRPGRRRGPQDGAVPPPDEFRLRPARRTVGTWRRPRDRRPRCRRLHAVTIGVAVDGSRTSGEPSPTGRSTAPMKKRSDSIFTSPPRQEPALSRPWSRSMAPVGRAQLETILGS